MNSSKAGQVLVSRDTTFETAHDFEPHRQRHLVICKTAGVALTIQSHVESSGAVFGYDSVSPPLICIEKARDSHRPNRGTLPRVRPQSSRPSDCLSRPPEPPSQFSDAD